MIIKFKGEEINLSVRKVSLIGRISGLMFRSSNSENLLFEFGKNKIIAIHSFFVFFPFLAIWLDDENNVLDFKIVNPFIPMVKSDKLSRKLVEIPINGRNKDLVRLIVGRGKV